MFIHVLWNVFSEIKTSYLILSYLSYLLSPLECRSCEKINHAHIPFLDIVFIDTFLFTSHPGSKLSLLEILKKYKNH